MQKKGLDKIQHPYMIKKKISKKTKTKTNKQKNLKKLRIRWDFPGGPVVKNPPCNERDTGSIPTLGRSHMLQSN